jgi:hypothetical protein
LAEVIKSSGLLSNYIQKEVFHNFSDPELIVNIQTKLQTSLSQLANMWSQYAQML